MGTPAESARFRKVTPRIGLVPPATLHFAQPAAPILRNRIKRVQGPWLSGQAFGLADIALVPYVDWIDRLGFAGLWAEGYPEVGSWLDAMKARASYAPAFDAFIPEQMAVAQRGNGEKYWPELDRIWTGILAAAV